MDDLRQIVKHLPDDAKIEGETREKLLKRLEHEQKKGYVDWITISTNILFSMNYCYSLDALKKDTLYNKVRKSNYFADGYLAGVEVVKKRL